MNAHGRQRDINNIATRKVLFLYNLHVRLKSANKKVMVAIVISTIMSSCVNGNIDISNSRNEIASMTELIMNIGLNNGQLISNVKLLLQTL